VVVREGKITSTHFQLQNLNPSSLSFFWVFNNVSDVAKEGTKTSQGKPQLVSNNNACTQRRLHHPWPSRHEQTYGQ